MVDHREPSGKDASAGDDLIASGRRISPALIAGSGCSSNFALPRIPGELLVPAGGTNVAVALRNRQVGTNCSKHVAELSNGPNDLCFNADTLAAPEDELDFLFNVMRIFKAIDVGDFIELNDRAAAITRSSHRKRAPLNRVFPPCANPKIKQHRQQKQAAERDGNHQQNQALGGAGN